MRILQYAGLDVSNHGAAYARVRAALSAGDFRAADARKLTGSHHAKLYRAKLNDSDRLLFSLLRHQGETCVVMLEVVVNHAYERSRFLRGQSVDESRLLPASAPVACSDIDAHPLRYLDAHRSQLLYLDKPLSLDDTQDAIYRTAAPLIVVGGAGSGKTALTLEKLKCVEGDVLYVTLSAWLARSARELYCAHGFEHEAQDASFLSYRELLECIRIPAGREAGWREFAAWFERQRQVFKGLQAHQVFEEFRGVIAAQPDGVLGCDQYVALGVRQSIFTHSERQRVYDLFERYRRWLRDEGWFDPCLIAHEWRTIASPRFDFIVIDEIQDLTPAQLTVPLRMLRHSDQFLLCGDSNQIVHPNFFSWGRIKSLFWQDQRQAVTQNLHVLRNNFRNGASVTAVANRLLRIKQARFGSIDRESNHLVQAVGEVEGSITLLADKGDATRTLDEQTRRSASVAVIVLHDEDKAEARRHFQTPLVFSIQESKGLEYETVILYRLISGRRPEYAEVASGVVDENLQGEEIAYRRAVDKSDKSLEIYKFYVNALYVALTRAVRNVYWVEADVEHPLLRLLKLQAARTDVKVETRAATSEEWQMEARRLELQGKQEQADAVRARVLREQTVPWTVFNDPWLRASLGQVFDKQVPGGKIRQQLFEYAAYFDEPVLAHWLAQEDGYARAEGFEKQRSAIIGKHLNDYRSRVFKGVLQQCDRFGVDHRTVMNQTPLMAAAMAGNLALVEALMARGANPDAVDHLGCNALHWSMRVAFRDRAYARSTFGAMYELIAPSLLDFAEGGRLVRIERNRAEYFLLQSLWVGFRKLFTRSGYAGPAALDTAQLIDWWEHLPDNVVRAERRKRSHLSNVLSRNEIDRDYAYNRRLFKRIGHGRYQINPALSVRRRSGDAESWVPVLEALNLSLVHECAHPSQWRMSRSLWEAAGRPALATPVAGRRWEQRVRAEEDRPKVVWAQSTRRDGGRSRPTPVTTAPAGIQPIRATVPTAAPVAPAPWGTPAARRAALDALRKKIDAKRQNDAAETDET